MSVVTIEKAFPDKGDGKRSLGFRDLLTKFVDKACTSFSVLETMG